MFVSVKICDILEFVKLLLKVLTKFNGQKVSILGAGCILKTDSQTQYLTKMGAETKSFVCTYVRWKQKIRKIPVLHKHGIY